MKSWLGTLALGLLLATPSIAQAECPVLAPIGDKTVTAGQLLTFTATATDADAGQTLTFSLINLIPDGAAIDPVTGVFTWTPASGPAASDVTVQVADNATEPCLDSEIIHVIVSAAGGENACPVLAPIGDKTVTAGQLLTFTATATDADAGQTLTFSLINLIPDGAAIDPATGVFTWTPATGPAASDVTVQVADNASTPCLDSEIIHVTVSAAPAENQCPVLAPIGDKTVTAGQLLTFTATATDADAGQTLTFSLINLIPDGAAIDPATGVFTWTPATGPAASDVTVQVADNASTPCLDSEIIHVTVSAAPAENQCPVLAPIGDKTVTAGQLLTFTATATDADAGQTLTFSLINLIPDGAAIDPATGVFTWTPASGPAASDVTVQVADNATTPCLDSEIIHVTVSAAPAENQCPVLAPIGDKTATAGQLLTFTATATDADAGQTLTFSLINLIPAGAAIDPATGVFTWTPASGPAASDVTVQVADNATTPCLDSEIIHVTVSAAPAENQCPVLAPIGDKTATAGQLLTFTATATDADAGQTLTFSLINAIPAGAAIDPATGVFTWTPATGPAASDVTVQVADNATTPCLDSEIIHVIVSAAGGENHCPVLAPIGDKTATAGQLLTFTATATDADAGQTLTFSLINAIPAGAAIDPATGVFTWTPATGPAASDVTVQVADNATTPCLDSEIIHVIVSAAGGEGADFETTAELIGALNPHRKFLCFRIRQSDAGFDLDDVDMSTLTLTYMEQSIDALGGKTHLGCDGDDGDDNDAVVALLGHGHGNDKDKGNDNDKGNGNGNGNGDGDGDGDGGDCDADQLHACFSMSDINHLVGSGNLRAGLSASEIHGSLNTGETFVATLGGKHMAELPGNGNHNGLQESPLKLKVRPNPLNPKADISFTLTNAGHVRVALYDLNGRLVKTILDENRAAGDHSVSWSGASDRNGRVPSGVYFVKVATQQGEAMQRVTVLK